MRALCIVVGVLTLGASNGFAEDLIRRGQESGGDPEPQQRTSEQAQAPTTQPLSTQSLPWYHPAWPQGVLAHVSQGQYLQAVASEHMSRPDSQRIHDLQDPRYRDMILAANRHAANPPFGNVYRVGSSPYQIQRLHDLHTEALNVGMQGRQQTGSPLSSEASQWPEAQAHLSPERWAGKNKQMQGQEDKELQLRTGSKVWNDNWTAMKRQYGPLGVKGPWISLPEADRDLHKMHFPDKSFDIRRVRAPADFRLPDSSAKWWSAEAARDSHNLSRQQQYLALIANEYIHQPKSVRLGSALESPEKRRMLMQAMELVKTHPPSSAHGGLLKQEADQASHDLEKIHVREKLRAADEPLDSLDGFLEKRKPRARPGIDPGAQKVLDQQREQLLSRRRDEALRVSRNEAQKTLATLDSQGMRLPEADHDLEQLRRQTDAPVFRVKKASVEPLLKQFREKSGIRPDPPVFRIDKAAMEPLVQQFHERFSISSDKQHQNKKP